ncbi:MAG: PAS domain-containing protein [Thermodesulfobacteriota bacterium]
MMPNTGAAIVALGAALWLLVRENAAGPRRAVGRVLGGTAALVGLLTIVEYATGVDLQIDRVLFGDEVRAARLLLPGRPSPASALALLCAGAALSVMDLERRGRATNGLVATVMVLAFATLSGYLFAEPEALGAERLLMRHPVFTPMALPTAIAFLFLGLGIAAARPQRSPLALLAGTDVGAFMARSALPAVVVVPVAFAWLRMQGERGGYYPTSVGAALLTTYTVTALVGVVLWSAAALRRLDVARRAGDEALRAARARLDLALSAGSVGTWIYDLSCNRVVGDARLEEVFGVSVAAPAGAALETLMAAIHPDDRARVGAAIDDAIRRRAPYEVEYRIVRADGSVRWVVARGACDVNEATGEIFVPGALVDITDRKRLEQHQELLSAAGLRFSASLDPECAGAAVAEILVPAVGDWCVVDVVDDDDRPSLAGLAASDPAARDALRERVAGEPGPALCLGTVAAEMLGAEGPILVDHSAGTAHAALLGRLDIGSGLLLPLLVCDRRLGTIFVATTAAGRRFDAEDLALGMDVARRAALAIENASLYRASRRATRMRDEVLRVVAHDLRNPLAAIAMDASLIERSLDATREAERRRLDRIYAAVGRADRLINDLLDVARLDAVPLLFRPFWQARPGGGAGLGLPIAKGLTEAHGGRIGVERAPIGGSTFWFTLRTAPCPMPTDAAREEHAAATRIQAPASGER